MSTLVFLNAVNVFSGIKDSFLNACQRWHVTRSIDMEDCYDWIVKKAIYDIVHLEVYRHIYIAQHHRHDVYLCIYDELKNQLTPLIRQVFLDNNLQINLKDRVQIIVTEFEIIIMQRNCFFNQQLQRNF